MTTDTQDNISVLRREALSARTRAHNPYSKYSVGAAVLTSDGRVFSGCNIENSSYGATLCAERVAIAKAVSEGAKTLKEILVVTENSPPSAPCGMCRQFMSEFAAKDLVIHLANPTGETTTHTFSELLPKAFTPEQLI